MLCFSSGIRKRAAYRVVAAAGRFRNDATNALTCAARRSRGNFVTANGAAAVAVVVGGGYSGGAGGRWRCGRSIEVRANTQGPATVHGCERCPGWAATVGGAWAAGGASTTVISAVDRPRPTTVGGRERGRACAYRFRAPEYLGGVVRRVHKRTVPGLIQQLFLGTHAPSGEQ